MNSSNIPHKLPQLSGVLTFPTDFHFCKYVTYRVVVKNNTEAPYEVLGVYSTLPAAKNRVLEARADHNYTEWRETENYEGLIDVDALTIDKERVRIRIEKVPHDWERRTQAGGGVA
jgi:hypothetical protein